MPDAPSTPVVIRTHPWHDRRHHRPGGGFCNPWDPPRDTPFLKALLWFLGHALRRKEERPPAVRTRSAADLAAPPERLRVTWIGHASTLVQTPTQNLLLDPVFSDRASPLTFAGPDRKVGLPFGIDALPRVDAVLLTHDHYDHLDREAVRALQDRHRPLFLAPLGVDRYLRAWGADRVAALDWGQFVDLGGGRAHCTPTKHFSGRGLHNRDGTLWCGWYLELGDATLYYVGDTGYSDVFRTVREHLGAPDVALVPIGAYRPRWFMSPVHVDPEEAVTVFEDIEADAGIAIHWGTFDLAEEPIHRPPEELRRHLAARGLDGRFHVLDVGGRFELT